MAGAQNFRLVLEHVGVLVLEPGQGVEHAEGGQGQNGDLNGAAAGWAQ
jgi:hypothetical protein